MPVRPDRVLIPASFLTITAISLVDGIRLSNTHKSASQLRDDLHEVTGAVALRLAAVSLTPGTIAARLDRWIVAGRHPRLRPRASAQTFARRWAVDVNRRPAPFALTPGCAPHPRVIVSTRPLLVLSAAGSTCCCRHRRTRHCRRRPAAGRTGSRRRAGCRCRPAIHGQAAYRRVRSP